LIAVSREAATLRHDSARLPMRTEIEVLRFGPLKLD
jgi:hypothetical protein